MIVVLTIGLTISLIVNLMLIEKLKDRGAEIEFLRRRSEFLCKSALKAEE